jgi:hypothetical protein
MAADDDTKVRVLALLGAFAGKGRLTTGEDKPIKDDIWRRRKSGHLDLHGRPVPVAGKTVGGRLRNFDDKAKADLQRRLEPYVRKLQDELGRLPFRTNKDLLTSAKRLVSNRGLASGDKIITRQLIDPVLQKLRRKRHQKNS